MKDATFICINPHSHQGLGWKRWKSIQGEIRKLLPGAKELITESIDDMAWQAGSILSNFTQGTMISAGGDGSVHHLANVLLESGKAKSFNLGAIGLGSSNDFLKPFQAFVGRIPVRIQPNANLFHDVGEVHFVDEHNLVRKKFFLINASIGVTATGNERFNNPGRVIQWLKKISTDLAIKCTALATILTYHASPATICYDGSKKQIMASNIHILKRPFVAGGLHYSQEVLPDDGLFGLNVCLNMNKLDLLQTLVQLQIGKFETDEKRISAFTNKVEVQFPIPTIFECDGETSTVRELAITVRPKAIKLLNAI